jgi:hypothetical protein
MCESASILELQRWLIALIESILLYGSETWKLREYNLQFLPYGRSIGPWMSYTQDVYISHGTEYDTIWYKKVFCHQRCLNQAEPTHGYTWTMCTSFSLAGHLLLAVEECCERCYRLHCQANTEKKLLHNTCYVTVITHAHRYARQKPLRNRLCSRIARGRVL